MPKIKVKIGNKKVFATYDTGSNGGLVVNDVISVNRIKASKNIKVETLSGSLGLNGFSNDLRTNNYIFDTTIHLDNLELNSQDVVIINNVKNNMGFEFIKQFNSILDVENKYIYIDRDNITVAESNDILGFSLLKGVGSGKNIINGLSVDANTTLKLGDEVVKINNKELDGLDNCEIRILLKDVMKSSGGNQITIEVVRDNVISNATYNM